MNLIDNWHVIQENKDKPYAVYRWILEQQRAFIEARRTGTAIGKELTSAIEKELDKVFK